MSRIRSIHPGLFTDEAWASLSIEARWLGIGLLTEADDNGVFEWKPLQLKMRIFPADAVDINALVDQLLEAGIIERFDMSGKRLCGIRNFCRYQRPRKPKAWHPISAEIRVFVGLDEAPPEPDDDDARLDLGDEPDAVKTQSVPTKSETSPQREDGGWKMEDEGGRREEPPTPLKPPEPEWSEYRRFRKRIKKPLTPHGEKLAITNLMKLTADGGNPIAIINQSIMNGWTGLFPEKKNGQRGYNNSDDEPRNPMVRAALDAEAERIARGQVDLEGGWANSGS